jgi:endoglucanase
MKRLRLTTNVIKIHMYRPNGIVKIGIHLINIFLILTAISCSNDIREKKCKFSHTQSADYSSHNKFQFQRGINISHWLSQSPEKGSSRDQFFTKDDIKMIAGLGYDHIRIPMDEDHLWDEQGNKQAKAFQLLHNAIGWCMDNKLKIVLDLHQIRSHSFNNEKNTLWDSKEEQDHFVQMWMQLSDEFKRYSVDFVAYDFLN